MSSIGDQIKSKLLEGKHYGEIIQDLKVAASTVAYHARQLGMRKFTYVRKLYDWVEVQNYYTNGYTLNEIKRHFGMNSSTLREAINRGDLCILSNKNPIRKIALRSNREITGRTKYLSPEQVLVESSGFSMNVVKSIIKEQSLLPYYCSNEHCVVYEIENTTWANKPLTLHLDHINGIRNDHRLENLRWLCPNCHSQTTTYCGRNNKR